MAKDKSPFYPGQPVPVELFVGRAAEIDRIMIRGAAQTAAGKPMAFFAQGEYGIGKSSVAGYVQRLAEKDYGLHGIYASLGGCRDLTDVASQVLQSTLLSKAFQQDRSERVRNWLSKYIGDQALFGFKVNLAALKQDAPQLSTPFGMLGFLDNAVSELRDTGVKGVFLVLDEINGITSNPDFAHFIKGLVDQNALQQKPVPLLLMLCGVEEKRREMIQRHQPVDRIFDVVDISTLSPDEMYEFFMKSFDSVGITVAPEAMSLLTHYSAGFPKIMHLVGDNAFWKDKDGHIDAADAADAVIAAATEVGLKYVDQQVYNTLRSEAYRSILETIGKLPPTQMSFTRNEIRELLSKTELDKLSNFLQKMKQLKVLKPGDSKGVYIFRDRMVRLYTWLRAKPDLKSLSGT